MIFTVKRYSKCSSSNECETEEFIPCCMLLAFTDFAFKIKEELGSVQNIHNQFQIVDMLLIILASI